MTDNRANGDKSNTITLLEFSKAIGAKETLLSLKDVTYILDLINRLKADIEERTDQFNRMSKVAHKLRSELVSLKVGIEKLKEKAVKTYYGELVFTEDDFDNLLKEMG